MISEKDNRWNRFINDVCGRELEELSEVQKAAVLCFWYDAEMQSGGHSGYFGSYPETDPEELIASINRVAYKEISDNFQRALDEKARDNGDENGYETVDDAYYDFEPSLFECLRQFTEKYKDEMLR